MTGSALLKHSWGMVWRNKMDAARISVVLLVFSMVVVFAFSFATSMSPGFVLSAGPAGIILLQVLQHVLSILIGAWWAVAWHRYLLLHEDPEGWLPHFHGAEVLRYSLWIILMMIAFFLAFVPVFAAMVPLLLDIESGTSPNVGLIALWGVVALGVVTFAMIAMLRLSPVLVSRALGERLGIGQAWAATRGTSGAIFALYLHCTCCCS